MYAKYRELLLSSTDRTSKVDEFVSLSDAVECLMRELSFPEDRARRFIKHFDLNDDGQLSAEELAQLTTNVRESKNTFRLRFKEYDVDGSGFVSMEEAKAILTKEPFHFPSGKVALLLSQFDKDGNGELDLEEFSCFFAEAQASKNEIARKFDELDVDKNGLLTHDELDQLLRDRMGYDEVTSKNLVKVFDDNQDGVIDKSEFCRMWWNMFN